MTGFMGRDHVYVIAEIGSNHGGSLAAAFDLIDAAADAGADAAKFQAGHADHIYDPAQFPEEHASFRRYLEPPLEWLPQLAARCEERGINFGCSVFCLDALDAVDPYVKWHKVASIEADWCEFTAAVANKLRPMLISNGMSRWSNPIAPWDRIALHCTVSYPASLEDANLRAHPRDPWGLSDHTAHPTIVPCAAVALGAIVVEKHIRLDAPDFYGGDEKASPDWNHSIDPEQFREMVGAIRLTETALGSDEKRIRKSEEPYLRFRRGPRGLRGA